MKEPEARSPLTGRPLRNPGQSLEEEMARIFDEEIGGYAVSATIAILFTAVEWLRWWLDSPYQPGAITLLAVGAVMYSAFRIRQRRRALATLKLGRDGEKAVGQYLDLLRRDGYRIFHDVIADGFNIDHVIISSRGIFAVETKTWSKPAGRKAVVEVRGDTLVVDGWAPDRDPLQQVKANAGWLRATLKESTGKEFPVQGVVLFPGWWVDGKPSDRSLWVLNPKALPGFLEELQPVLAEEDVSLATYHLSRYIRVR
jgi:hypothetical protein